MASLPWAAIVNILARLPVKDLLRYRCVSKLWCSLIDGPDFIKMHLNHSMETSSNLGLIRAGRQLHWVGLDTLNKAVRLKPPSEQVTRDAHFGKFMKVPISDKENPGKFEFGTVGFGYDPVNDDHKFLRMTHYFGRDSSSFESEVKVYSLKSKTWKRVGDHLYHGYHCESGVLVGNSLHWMMRVRFPDSTSVHIVVAFDFVTEKYWEILLPDKKSKQEYGVKESWTKLFSVVPSDVTGVFKSATPLAYLKSARQVLFDLDGEKLMVYDLDTKKAKSVRKISECPKCLHTFISVGSLVGLGGLGGGDGENSGKKEGENGDNREKQEQQPGGQKR
ncbi:F-box domain containing protein [Trema orientale]|uniref:F-box domain containing protein n=1 Tax=Trema orientale TaxID=63057 RepID=A0A2P5F0N6_TREOI|nr:F-box domain containing protein [Trema orientale]